MLPLEEQAAAQNDDCRWNGPERSSPAHARPRLGRSTEGKSDHNLISGQGTYSANGRARPKAGADGSSSGGRRAMSRSNPLVRAPPTDSSARSCGELPLIWVWPGSRWPATRSIACHGSSAAAHVGLGRNEGRAFRGRAVHGPARGRRHPGAPPAASRGPVADLADSADPRGSASWSPPRPGSCGTSHRSRVRLHVWIASQAILVTATIYATGWGPALAIGLVLVGQETLAVAGPASERVILGWTLTCLAAGEGLDRARLGPVAGAGARGARAGGA